MLLDMAEKIRLVLLVDEEVQAALRMEANKRTSARTDRVRVTMGEVLEELVREGLADTLEELRKARAAQEKKGKGKDKKEG